MCSFGLLQPELLKLGTSLFRTVSLKKRPFIPVPGYTVFGQIDTPFGGLVSPKPHYNITSVESYHKDKLILVIGSRPESANGLDLAVQYSTRSLFFCNNIIINYSKISYKLEFRGTFFVCLHKNNKMLYVGFQVPLSRPNYRRLRSQAGPRHNLRRGQGNKKTRAFSFFSLRLASTRTSAGFGPIHATLITNTAADHCALQTRDEKTTPRHSRTRTAAHPRTTVAGTRRSGSILLF